MENDTQRLFNAVIAKDLIQVQNHVDTDPSFIDHINRSDESGYTLLHTAICTEASEIVKCLVEHNADVNAKVQSAKMKMNAVQSHLAVSNGVSPLHLAVSTGDVNLVGYLLHASADIDALDFDRKSPLHCACYHGHGDIVKLLVDNMAGINLQDSSGSTPLHHAAYLLSQGVVIYEYLVCAGADDSIPNQNGQRPSDLIDTWFSESEDTPEIRNSEGEETITSYSNLTITEEFPLSSMVRCFDDEETETTVLLENVDDHEIAPPSSPYSEVSRLTFVSEPSRVDAPALPSLDDSSLGTQMTNFTEAVTEPSMGMLDSESDLPMSIPHNPFLPTITSVGSTTSAPRISIEPVPLNSHHSRQSRSGRSRDQPAPSIHSIELPMSSLSLQSHDFFLGLDDPNTGEMMMYRSWSSEDNSRHGLSNRMRDTLPTRIYFEQDECVICKCEWVAKEVIKTLPCSHDFHASCIDQWLRISNTCPVCKQVVPGH